MRSAFALSAGLGLAAVLTSSGAFAAEGTLDVGEARERLDRLDATIGSIRAEVDDVAQGYRTPLRPLASRMERRLREAEVQSLLGDHFRASVLLFDVVERDELRSHPRYTEAVFLLAESLRRAGQPRAARVHYERLAREVSGARLAQVVLGILDVASRTGDFDGLEALVRRAKAEGAGQRRSQLDYAFGKALFRAGGTDPERSRQALTAFRAVPERLSVSAPAAYYEGVTLVRLGRLEEAIQAFERTDALAGSHPDTERVRELARLSLGRLHHELGRISAALDAYQGVSKDSVYFADMLFEVAWVYVKSAEERVDPEEREASFKRALDAVELLIAAAPESPLVPEARVLQGNLQIRLGAPQTAYETFEAVVDRYGQTRTRLDELMADRADARAFFDELVSADVDRLESAALLPPVVLNIALEDREIERAVSVQRGLRDARQDLEDAREDVRTLEAALRSEQRFSMFPGLRDARTKALVVQNRLLGAEQRLLAVERGLMSEHLDPSARVRLEAARVQGQDLESDIASLPTTDEGIEGSRARLKSEYEEVALEAFTLQEKVRLLRAQLQAVRHWMRDKGPALAPDEQALTDQRMVSARAEIEDLERALERVRAEVDRASLLSRADGGWARAERLRKQLYAAIDEQASILRPARTRAPPDVRGVTARIDQQRAALRETERDLVGLQTRLEQAVEARVDETRGKILEVLRAIQADRSEQTQLASAAEGLLAPVAQRTATAVGSELERYVVEADVGILDVAWARKRERTDEVTELVRDLRRRSSELEDEFGEVLQDDPQ